MASHNVDPGFARFSLYSTWLDKYFAHAVTSLKMSSPAAYHNSTVEIPEEIQDPVTEQNRIMMQSGSAAVQAIQFAGSSL